MSSCPFLHLHCLFEKLCLITYLYRNWVQLCMLKILQKYEFICCNLLSSSKVSSKVYNLCKLSLASLGTLIAKIHLLNLNEFILCPEYKANREIHCMAEKDFWEMVTLYTHHAGQRAFGEQQEIKGTIVCICHILGL